MPALSPSQLISAVQEAIVESAASGLLVSAQRTHPRKFACATDSGPLQLWVYIWTLTSGGRPQLANEYRIQMTSVRSPLLLNPNGPTVLLGYEPNLEMFAGFDVERHKTFTSGSPSVQIDITALREALQNGLAFHRKDNDEIAVGVRPDQLMNYVESSSQLHRLGKRQPILRLLQSASELAEIPDIDIDRLSGERRRIVQTVKRISRSASFRVQVLNAYGHRCAITRLQLRLVEAAHILPAAGQGSVDHVVNGIALSPTYHRAFDSGLIFLDATRTMRINPTRERELQRLRLIGGLEGFERALGPIHLPADRHQWPDARFIKRANRARRIEVL